MEQLINFFKREMTSLHEKIDQLNQRHKETVKHLRTTKDMLVNCYRETTELRKEIQTLKEVPANRTFPLKSQDSVNKTTEIFADPKQCGKLKREIAYTLGNTTDDDWLRAFIKDDVVFLYQRADTLRHLNFIRYIIDEVNTPNKIFTAMVCQSKNRIYAHRKRQQNKAKDAGERPAGTPPKRPADEEHLDGDNDGGDNDGDDSDNDSDNDDGDCDDDDTTSPQFSPHPKKPKLSD